jgi:hypothetical protein
MSKVIITIETITAGQPRPYADSVYKYRVFCEYYWDAIDGPRLSDSYFLKDHEVLALLRASRSTQKWVKKEERDWHEAYLDYITEVEPGVWEVQIISPYLD